MSFLLIKQEIICKIKVNKEKKRLFMATGKIKSNTADAQEAVAELTGLQV